MGSKPALVMVDGWQVGTETEGCRREGDGARLAWRGEGEAAYFVGRVAGVCGVGE